MELEAAIAPLLWRGIAAGAVLAILAALLLARGTSAGVRVRETVALRDRLLIAAITLLGAALRLPPMTRPLGTDEAATFLYYVSRPLIVGLTIYGSPNNHLFHTALAHATVRLFGDAEWALRLPAFVAGVALIPLTWLTSRRIGASGGLIAAALVAATPALIDYSTDARGYTMLSAFTLIAASAMHELVRRGTRRDAAIFALASALGFYTIPVMLYPFVFLAVWGLLRAERRRPVLVALGAAVLLTATLYAPVILVSGIEALTANPYVRPLAMSELLGRAPGYGLAVWSRMMVGIPLVLQLVIGVAAIAGRRLTLPAGAGVLAIAIVLLAQRVLPFPRVWLPFLPLLLIAAAAAWRWPRLEFATAIALLLVLGALAVMTPRVRDTGELPGVDRIARTLRTRLRAGDAVLATTPSDLPLAFYLRGAPADVLHPDVAHARRLFVVANRDAGQTLPRTLAAFGIDPRRCTVQRIEDRGSAAVYLLTR